MYALPRVLERYRRLTIAGQVVYPDYVVDFAAEAVDGSSSRNMEASCAGWPRRCRLGGCPARRTALNARRRSLCKEAVPTTSNKR